VVCIESYAYPPWLHGIDHLPLLCVFLAGTVRFQEIPPNEVGVATVISGSPGAEGRIVRNTGSPKGVW
jgi:hypothetical protein